MNLKYNFTCPMVSEFEAIAPGRYFVVVALPSRISGYKVAWHAPIEMPAHRSVSIEFNRDNIVLATFSRDFGAVVVEADVYEH